MRKLKSFPNVIVFGALSATMLLGSATIATFFSTNSYVSAQPRELIRTSADPYKKYDVAPFLVTVASYNGINLRTNTHLSARSDISVPAGFTFQADAYFYGEPHEALGLGTLDFRWYQVTYNGQKYWVPAGWVYGDAPGSTPNPYNLKKCPNGNYESSC